MQMIMWSCIWIRADQTAAAAAAAAYQPDEHFETTNAGGYPLWLSNNDTFGVYILSVFLCLYFVRFFFCF